MYLYILFSQGLCCQHHHKNNHEHEVMLIEVVCCLNDSILIMRITWSSSCFMLSAPTVAQAKKSYDVDDKDFFWEACGTHQFPKVAEEVETQLQR